MAYVPVHQPAREANTCAEFALFAQGKVSAVGFVPLPILLFMFVVSVKHDAESSAVFLLLCYSGCSNVSIFCCVVVFLPGALSAL